MVYNEQMHKCLFLQIKRGNGIEIMTNELMTNNGSSSIGTAELQQPHTIGLKYLHLECLGSKTLQEEKRKKHASETYVAVFSCTACKTCVFCSKIRSFSQRGSGLQSLEAQLFTASDIPLQKVDFSNNLLRRITERTFDGIEDTLKEINFSNNKLGEQLNALFSTGEFQKLTQLEKLDLSGNEIKEFQVGLFNGLVNLQELNLERNFIITVPRSILQSLKSLKILQLQSNYILDIGAHSFPNLTNLQLF
ncbi:chaoptin [Caerostris extrusa]|uniref:Chaoptin n=1 Tax=Caerostris extrusa TaxID=172846 RepID=A0AAV4NP05_CAEEX|nr:chaoptin [Caerostris extrusa]